MKNFKNILHIFITVASLLGFLGGWTTLAHSRKPIQTGGQTEAQALEPLQPLAPLPAYNSATSTTANNNNAGVLSIFNQAPAPRTRARAIFRTSGS
jgi:hypothetical protein